jgi:hypothetical protein
VIDLDQISLGLARRTKGTSEPGAGGWRIRGSGDSDGARAAPGTGVDRLRGIRRRRNVSDRR